MVHVLDRDSMAAETSEETATDKTNQKVARHKKFTFCWPETVIDTVISDMPLRQFLVKPSSNKRAK